jgi:uncharacterized MAPEG superfamily protein
MTIELTMIVYSAGLTVLLAFPPTLALIPQLGLGRLAGNRDEFPAVEGWIGRGRRAHQNMIENFAPFAALVLIAQAADISTAQTQLGAQLFFYGRVAHALVYYAGIPWARTAVFAVSLGGMFMILSALIA